MLSTPSEIFTDFGPSAFLPRRRPIASLDLARDRRELRRQLRTHCPTLAGVYGMVDRADRLIYVGVSRHLRQRLVTYFQGADAFEGGAKRDDRPRKELRIGRRAVRLVWEVAGHELLALLREQELIRRFKPDLNVRGRRRRRLAYIVLTADDAPRFRVTGKLPKSSRHHWGPFPHNGRLIRSVELLNRQFKLPDCPGETAMHFAGDGSLFPIVDRPLCLRGEVDRCLAPCSGATTRQEYFAQLARARAFLDGEDDGPLVELERALAEAVAERQFERAARLHEIQSDLELLRERLLPRPHEEPRSFVYPVARGRRTAWLLVVRGAILAVSNEPRAANSAARWLERLGKLPAVDSPLEERDAAETRIVQAWFRGRPDELTRVVDFDQARAICRKILVA
jgi:excinuclease ABC subunit C